MKPSNEELQESVRMSSHCDPCSTLLPKEHYWDQVFGTQVMELTLSAFACNAYMLTCALFISVQKFRAK